MINKYSNVPLYSQLKDMIIEKILKGEYRENSKIPSEQEFCEMYDISRPTVRQAVSELTNSGFLHKEKGKGTFVTRQKTSIEIKNYTGFTQSILDSAIPGEYDIISCNTIPADDNEFIQKEFNISGSNNNYFAEVTYLTYYGKEVASINTSYIPENIFPNIIEDIKTKKPTYEILRGKYPYVPSRSRSSLQVTFADGFDSMHLKLQPGQPVIHIRTLILSKSGQAVELIICKYRADKVQLMFENSK